MVKGLGVIEEWNFIQNGERFPGEGDIWKKQNLAEMENLVVWG